MGGTDTGSGLKESFCTSGAKSSNSINTDLLAEIFHSLNNFQKKIIGYVECKPRSVEEIISIYLRLATRRFRNNPYVL